MCTIMLCMGLLKGALTDAQLNMQVCWVCSEAFRVLFGPLRLCSMRYPFARTHPALLCAHAFATRQAETMAKRTQQYRSMPLHIIIILLAESAHGERVCVQVVMVYVGQNVPARFRLYAVYHVLGWGMPAVIVIVALAKERIGQ